MPALFLILCVAGQAQDGARQDPPPPPHARLDVVEQMRADLAAQRHPADGTGRARIVAEGSDAQARVGQPGRWIIEYQAGGAGVAAGGVVFLQVSPFWGWSTPQVEAPELPGYTEISCPAAGVRWSAATIDQQLLAVTLERRGLKEGETLRFHYGAGAAGAHPDRFAERQSRFWIAVDGDGDGVRQVLADSPGVDVLAGEPVRLHVTLPSTAAPGERVRLTTALLDQHGNRAAGGLGEVFFELPDGLETRGAFSMPEGGAGSVEVEVKKAGVYRVKVSGFGFTGESNPMLVKAGIERVYWGDLQVHTALSDGSGALEDVYRYARDVAALDLVAVTDHDHWGMLFLDQHPESWEEMQRQARRFHEPGRFLSFLGFEWTNWIYGHRHVLYGGDDGPLLSSMDPRYDSPPELWAALRGRDALTIAHHSAGGPVAVDWAIAPDPELEPVTEIVSVHGSSEASDCPNGIYRAVAGGYVRDALDRGYRLGFLGSSDGHDGHPGLSHLAAASGGLAAVLCDELTREAVFAALRQRRVYATNGPRIVLRFAWDGRPMGSVLAAAGEQDERRVPLMVRVFGTAPIARVELIRSGIVSDGLDGGGKDVVLLEGDAAALRAGEYVYVRVIQEDGGMAWSSPVYAE